MQKSLGSIGLLVSSLLLGAGGASQTDTVTVGNRLDNPNFNNEIGTAQDDPPNNWVVTSGNVGRRGVNSLINGNSDPTDERNTFAGLFTTGQFAALGDPGGDIGSDNQSGLSSFIQHFRAPAQLGGRDVLSYSLNLSFDNAFDGITDESAQSNAPSDSFTVSLQRLRANGNNGPDVPRFSRSLGLSDASQFSGHIELPLALNLGA